MGKPDNIKDGGMFWAERPAPVSHLEDVAHLEDPTERPDYFEWWYFDATTDSGERIVYEFHYSNFFLSPRIPSLLLQIRTPDGKVLSKGHMFRGGWQSEGRVSASSTQVDVRFGDRGFVRGTYPVYQVSMEHETIGANLKFQFATPGWKAHKDVWFPLAFYDEATKDEFSHLIMPDADVEGEIRVGNKVTSVRGKGYHDHQWGNIAFRDVISHWYWGRAISGDRKLCFMSSGRAPDGDRYPEEVNGLLVVDKGQIMLATNQVRFTASDFIHDDLTDKHIPHTLQFRTEPEGRSTNVDATIRIKEISGKSNFQFRSKHLRAYLRLIGECEATINIKGESSRFEGDAIVGDMFFH